MPDTDEFEVDDRREGQGVFQHLVAGAVAGTAEHCGMYPIDTIKTNMQARTNLSGLGMLQTTKQILLRHGLTGLFRGVSAVAAGAAPAHALHFATYEFAKARLGGLKEGHHPLVNAAAGACATMVSDGVLTPMDAIKQKMQLATRNYRGLVHCVQTVIKLEGFRALYAAYTTTLLMNIPYNAVYFASYESFRRWFKRGSERQFDLQAHFFAGGAAGSLAAALTNPFDVAKTRLQTQADTGKKYEGLVDAMVTIWKEEGRRGFFRGLPPRIALHSTSAAICWMTYEWMKHCLTNFGIR